MPRNTRRILTSEVFVLLVFAGITFTLIFCANQSRAESNRSNSLHIFSEPLPTPDITASKCPEKAAAYAAAIVALIDAQQAADEAYRLWYDCEHGGGMQRRHSEISSVGHSILITD